MVVFIRSVFNLCGMRRKEENGDIFLFQFLSNGSSFVFRMKRLKLKIRGGKLVFFR
jgi:hypothetical protein